MCLRMTRAALLSSCASDWSMHSCASVQQNGSTFRPCAPASLLSVRTKRSHSRNLQRRSCSSLVSSRVSDRTGPSRDSIHMYTDSPKSLPHLHPLGPSHQHSPTLTLRVSSETLEDSQVISVVSCAWERSSVTADDPSLSSPTLLSVLSSLTHTRTSIYST